MSVASPTASTSSSRVGFDGSGDHRSCDLKLVHLQNLHDRQIQSLESAVQRLTDDNRAQSKTIEQLIATVATLKGPYTAHRTGSRVTPRLHFVRLNFHRVARCQVRIGCRSSGVGLGTSTESLAVRFESAAVKADAAAAAATSAQALATAAVASAAGADRRACDALKLSCTHAPLRRRRPKPTPPLAMVPLPQPQCNRRSRSA
jgi:hypothetical protein